MTDVSPIYGPVTSRRLGRSLGISLVPRKACPYDCIHCTLGPTTDLTVDRKSHIAPNDVIEALTYRLSELEAQDRKIDTITIAGFGEATLNLHIGEIEALIRRETRLPTAILTSGGLLARPSLRREMTGFDIVIAYLHAGGPETFQLVHRPHPDVRFDDVCAGLSHIKGEMTGRLWLEVMVCSGITDSDPELDALAQRVLSIDPDHVHIDTPTSPRVRHLAAPRERLRALARRIGERAVIIAP
ncbi:MAG: radical SAM protein [Deltaproteobacteria bacterium]|nr:radical SAM protein [Candidatus Zymogenaceae bacterium]